MTGNLETKVKSIDVETSIGPKIKSGYFCTICGSQEGELNYRKKDGKFLAYCTSCGEEIDEEDDGQ